MSTNETPTRRRLRVKEVLTEQGMSLVRGFHLQFSSGERGRETGLSPFQATPPVLYAVLSGDVSARTTLSNFISREPRVGEQAWKIRRSCRDSFSPSASLPSHIHG